MHKAILSDRERKLLNDFLNDEKITDETFRMLKLRIKSYHEKLHQDLNLIDLALKKFEK